MATEEKPAVAGARWGGRRWILLAALVVLGGGAYWLASTWWAAQPGASSPAGRQGGASIPVVVATTRQGDMPVVLSALGSVTAFNTVTVRSRVDGELVRVGFEEGQLVRAGDLLAQIDSRPFEAQLAQAEGQLARDRAQLQDAKINLVRYRELLGRQFVPRQQVDSQAAQVAQFEGMIRTDEGLIAAVKLQLTYCRITAPIAGRVGLRVVDVGNMVQANDPNGLVVITQVQPIAVLFTIPEDDLPLVLGKLRGGEQLAVEAFDRSGETRVGVGTLLTADNRIDQSTGTARLKAVFDNADNALFPNQFVNVRLRIESRPGTIIAPAAAVQRGPTGTFVFVVKDDQTVEVRPVRIGPTAGLDVAIDSGLAAEERVVVEGVDRLRSGSTVRIRGAEGESSGKPPA